MSSGAPVKCWGTAAETPQFQVTPSQVNQQRAVRWKSHTRYTASGVSSAVATRTTFTPMASNIPVLPAYTSAMAGLSYHTFTIPVLPVGNYSVWIFVVKINKIHSSASESQQLVKWTLKWAIPGMFVRKMNLAHPLGRTGMASGRNNTEQDKKKGHTLAHWECSANTKHTKQDVQVLRKTGSHCPTHKIMHIGGYADTLLPCTSSVIEKKFTYWCEILVYNEKKKMLMITENMRKKYAKHTF